MAATTPCQDLIQDLKVADTTPLDGCDGCEVHLGFNENYLALRGQLLQALSTVDTSGGLYISGHSLGAAMAVLAAFDLVRAALPQLAQCLQWIAVYCSVLEGPLGDGAPGTGLF